MVRRRYRLEQIIKKLREAEVLLSQGSTVGEAARKIGVTEQTYYRWRREYGDMRIGEVKRLKVPKKQPKRRRLWLNDGSCIRLRPNHKDHVWSYDLMMTRTAEGKAFKILSLIDEYTRECLTILTQRRITSEDVIEQLFYLFILRGTQEYIRSDHGPEFTAKAVRRWLKDLEVNTLFIERGSPWENGYIESFDRKLRDELLNREVFILH